MDPRDVPNHSPAHPHSFFDGNPGHLRSPPLSHDPSYGMHASAFSMMGRRPGLPDFRGTLPHDPILSSPGSLTSPGSLHSSLTAGAGGAAWWMPPHPHAHGMTPEYFPSHIPGSWLTHEHDCGISNHDRLDECLYPPSRSRSNMMNGVNSSGVFGSGSGIFYPPPASPQSVHSFVRQTSPTTSSSKNTLSHWSSHGNHDGKGGLDLGNSRDLEMAPSHLNRKLTNCSEESNDRNSELRSGDLALHHRERVKDANIRVNRELEKTKTSNSFPENKDLMSGNKTQVLQNTEHNNKNGQRPSNVAAHSDNSNIQTHQNIGLEKRNDKNVHAGIVEENHTSLNQTANLEPTAKSSPPKLQKVKSGPPPPLKVPSSILNTTEGIIPTKREPPVKKGKDLSAMLKEEMLKPSKKVVASTAKQTEKAQNIVSGEVKSKLKNVSEQNLASTSQVSSASQKPSSKLPASQPRVPSGKPPLIAHFKDVKYNEESSDDDSDSSNVSSDSESGSASDEDSEEGEEGENEEESSGSDTDSDGSEEDECGAEQQDDDEDEDDDDVNMESQEGGVSFEESTQSPSKRKLEEGSSGTPRKRRRAVNEDAIKIPLEKGWRRQTRLRQVGASGGLRGDVYYFAPCSKKLRTYPEVTRYLNKNGITDISIENFSFSTKLHIGEFLECKEGTEFVPLSEEEVNRRKQEADEKNRAKLEKLNTKREKKQKQAGMKILP